MKAQRVAILGAGGQIGRTVLQRLRREPTLDVTGICRNALTAAPLRAAGFDVRSGDVTVSSERARLIGDADVIINCASASCLWGQARREDRAVLDAILGASARVIHFSSVAVYGTCIDTAWNSFEDPRPDAPYGRDKLDLERYATRVARKTGRALTILRMGHVYGAEQWVSRFVFNQINTSFRLPYDGDRPSNAVHVNNVASAVRALVQVGATGTFNLVDPDASTWRQVFDWNTSAIGAKPIPTLDRAASDLARRTFTRRAQTARPVAVAREIAAWSKSLPLSLAASSPALRDLALSTMSALQSPRIEQKVLALYGEASVRKITEPLAVKETWLVSDGAPGPVVSYPSERDETARRQVAAWFDGYGNPDALWSTPTEAETSPGFGAGAQA